MRIVVSVILALVMGFGCSGPTGDSSMSAGDDQADRIQNLDIHRTYTEQKLSGTDALGMINVTYASPKRVDFTTDMWVLPAGQLDHFHLSIINSKWGGATGGGSLLSIAVFTRNADGGWQYQGGACGGCQDPSFTDMTFTEVWLEKGRASFYGLDPDDNELYLDINGGPPKGDVGFVPTPWRSRAFFVDTSLKGTYKYLITASCNDGPCGTSQ
jgi:hypothetical protein